MKFALLLSTLLSVPAFALTTLRVNGQAGVNQANFVWACHFQENDKHEVRAQDMKCTKIQLNQQQEVQSGLYYLEYSHSAANLTINEGDMKVVNLIQMQIPKTPGAKYFRVFRDYTQREEQEKIALAIWGSPEDTRILDQTKYKGDEYDRDTWENDCYSHPEKAKNCVFINFSEAQLCAGVNSKDAKAYCDARLSNDFRRLIGTGFSSADDGNISRFRIKYQFNSKTKTMSEDKDETGWSSNGRSYIADKASIDWGWISVLPGTYGVELTDDVNSTMIQLGLSAH